MTWIVVQLGGVPGVGAVPLAPRVTVFHYHCLSPCPGAYGLSGECGWAQWDPWDWTAVADRAGWCPFGASLSLGFSDAAGPSLVTMSPCMCWLACTGSP